MMVVFTLIIKGEIKLFLLKEKRWHLSYFRDLWIVFKFLHKTHWKLGVCYGPVNMQIPVNGHILLADYYLILSLKSTREWKWYRCCVPLSHHYYNCHLAIFNTFILSLTNFKYVLRISYSFSLVSQIFVRLDFTKVS